MRDCLRIHGRNHIFAHIVELVQIEQRAGHAHLFQVEGEGAAGGIRIVDVYKRQTFTWVNGRQLGALQKGDLGVSYSYNSDGLRVSKTVNGVKTEYVWDGSSLIGQKTGNNVLVYLLSLIHISYHRPEGEFCIL